MEAFEVNKIVRAVLSALLVVFGSKTVLDIAYKEHKPEKPGWALPITEVATATKEPAAPFDASKRGRAAAESQCRQRPGHLQEMPALPHAAKGRPERPGPNLWGVVGRKPGSHGGLPLLGGHEEQGWRVELEALATYLHDPKAAIPGNKMAFPGIKDDAELADLLAYLRKLSDTPAPLPQ